MKTRDREKRTEQAHSGKGDVVSQSSHTRAYRFFHSSRGSEILTAPGGRVAAAAAAVWDGGGGGGGAWGTDAC